MSQEVLARQRDGTFFPVACDQVGDSLGVGKLIMGVVVVGSSPESVFGDGAFGVAAHPGGPDSPAEQVAVVAAASSGRIRCSHDGSGGRGESHPPAPSDPVVKVSLHRAPLIDGSERANPLPLGEQSGLSIDQPAPPPLEAVVAPQPAVLPASPAPHVGVDAL